MTIDEALAAGIRQIQENRLDEAQRLFRAVLEVDPIHPDALHLLGVALGYAGNLAGAIELIQRAVDLDPQNVNFQNNLGHFLRLAGRLTEASAVLRGALRLKPGFSDALNNLGNTLRDQSQNEAAIACYREILQQLPDHKEALNNLGNALGAVGRMDEAIAAFRSAIQLDPANPIPRCNLGAILSDLNRLPEAESLYRAALHLDPNLAVAHNNLGNVMQKMRRLDDAVACFREAIRLAPQLAYAPCNLGNAYKNRGDCDLALACYRAALTVLPDAQLAHHNLLYTLYFTPGVDAAQIRAELRHWNQLYARPLKPSTLPYEIDRSPGRRLRIGYVSADFRDHVVGRNLLALFRHHDHQQFEIFCYANTLTQDHLTLQFQSLADHWHSIALLPDDAAADLVRAHRIDILVDLSLHMAGNRLLLFTRKPAPIQMTFAGYPGSTGLETIDYRLTDPWLDPPESGNSDDYSEESLRLAHTFWCFDPLPDDQVPPRGEFPAPSPGAIRFGCLNNICKINDSMIPTWAEILRQLPGATFTLLKEEPQNPRRIVDTFARHGIPVQRLVFVERRPRADYLRLFHHIDISLDTLPYNGHSTSIDSFWMGVPVITLVGKTIVGRAGYSQLMNLNLPELITYSSQQYVQLALELAHTPDRLTAYHKTLRQRMQNSSLMNAPAFARSIESAYRSTIPFA